MNTSKVSPDDVGCILNRTPAYVITYEKEAIVGLVSGLYCKEGNNESISGDIFICGKKDLIERFYPELVLEDIFDDGCYLSFGEECDDVDFLGKKEEGSTKILYFNRLTSATLIEALQVYRKRLEECSKSSSSGEELLKAKVLGL